MAGEIRLGDIMVDCGDDQGLCAFYHKLLGWEKCVLYGRPALRSAEGIVFLFIGEEDYAPPVWPEEAGRQQKQMHFDFKVPDVAAAVEYAVSLGAVKAARQFGGDGEFVTMIDPAGHPFCLCAEGNPA
jgi:predicted enzyme related to lactoylglutathione lyase